MRIPRKNGPGRLTIELSRQSVKAHATGSAAIACVAIVAIAFLLVVFLK